MDFPMQILIRSTYLDLSNYLNYVKTNVDNIENITLQKQGESYRKFLENINLQQ